MVAGREGAQGLIEIDMSEADAQPSLSALLRRLDARNRENLALAGLRIHTSADIFEATQREHEERRQSVIPVGSGPSYDGLAPPRAGQEYVSHVPALAGMGREEALRAVLQRTNAERLKETRESLGLRTAAESFEANRKELEEANRKQSEEANRKKREEANRKERERVSREGRVLVSQSEIEEAWRKHIKEWRRMERGETSVEAWRKKHEEAAWKRAGEEALRKEGQESLRKESEEAIRKEREEAKRKAEEEWRRKEEEAWQKDREEASRPFRKRRRLASSREVRFGEVNENSRVRMAAARVVGESVRDERHSEEPGRSGGEAVGVGAEGGGLRGRPPGSRSSQSSRGGMHGQSRSEPEGASVPSAEEVEEPGKEKELLDRIVQQLEEEFAEKKRLSDERMWCKVVSHETKVSTVQDFYKAFHHKKTLPLHTCFVCYRKYGSVELMEVDWRRWVPISVGVGSRSQFDCRRCFPDGETVVACSSCIKESERGVLSAAARLHGRLECEHMFPEELKGLTPVEEKLISLNSCYGFIARYAVQGGRRQSTAYPKHIKGHITVFPNNVQELVSNVLPHPLLKVMDDIHVSWHGRAKPKPSDLSRLLSVRRHVVERALVWLKRNNPLYAGIEIDTAEMESWGASEHGVPAQIYERLERNEPLASEKARTANVVPPTERGLEAGEELDVREVLATLNEEPAVEAEETEIGEVGVLDGQVADGNQMRQLDGADATVHEIGASGMFALDEQPDVADVEKVRYACDALGLHARRGGGGAGCVVGTGTAEVRLGNGTEPYIQVSRGEEFSDTYEASFFAKTFPTLFPMGRGGPRQAEESGEEGRAGEVNVSAGMEAAASGLLSSRNMSLESWAKVVLERHGGRFAMHHVFSFLVFNRLVMWRNRRASMMSVTRKSFPDVERIVRSLRAERLEAARVELETSGKTKDKDVNKLLRSLSLYGFRQPMSRESRLSMRRKIKALIIRYGIPAIWFTLNPNDITNPVKLRLAAYRIYEPGDAEEFLGQLNESCKRVRLAISDPLSSALFFHREVTMFFKHYVRVGKESVFGRVSQYFGAVETNERGALHLHGLIWLEGNMHMNSVLSDVQGEEQASYRDSIVEYVDSVFSEARGLGRLKELVADL